MKRDQSGFTLIELAIVLVIIGLLLGGVLKGQELIQSAKIKNVINDFSSTTVGYYGYQDRYKQIPGNDNAAKERWTQAVPAPVDGLGDGKITGTFLDLTGSQASQFWYHLRLSGFIGGSGEGGPLNAFGGQLGVQDGGDSFNNGTPGTGFKGLIICESHISDKAAAAIDNQLDDGNPNTGIIRAVVEPLGVTTAPTPGLPVVATAATAAANPYIETGNTTYMMCKSL